jgi:transposase
MNQFSLHVGIDVSKSWLDIAVLKPGKGFLLEKRINNTSRDIKQFVKELRRNYKEDAVNVLFCLEQTGKYCNAFLEVGSELSLSVWLELPLQIKRSQGFVRGKSDKLDAKRIAEYAFRFEDKVVLWKASCQSIQELKALQAKRSQLLKVIHQLTLSSDNDPILKKPLEALKKAMEDIDDKMESILRFSHKLKQQAELLKSIPGIGPQTALALIISTEGFSRLTDKRKLSCYAGLAPFPYSSGSSIKGKNKISKMGNMKLKALLNLSAWNAVRCIPTLKQYYERKVAEGKHKLSAINAVRNKMLAIAISVINRNTPFAKDYSVAFA